MFYTREFTNAVIAEGLGLIAPKNLWLLTEPAQYLPSGLQKAFQSESIVSLQIFSDCDLSQGNRWI